MPDPQVSPRTVAGHRAAIVDDLAPLSPFEQPLLDALGLAAADDLRAPMPLPSFDNSAMDGYAVRYTDVATAAEDAPVTLPVVGEIGAGHGNLISLPPGAAAKIMTGAPLPSGSDAVVPYEWTDRGVAAVAISQAPSLRQHVRAAGEDVATDDLLVSAGDTIGPRQLGLLAAVGFGRVRVRPRPRVVIISTGSELREPGTRLGRDSIYDGNSYLLAAAVRRAGGIAYRAGIVRDEPDAFFSSLEDQLVRADLVVTSGGVSAGDFDVVKEALAARGVWFGPVAMQPGKPQGYGRIGEDRVPIITLPGNPVSSYVSFEAFVLPALRKLMGRTPYARPTHPARLTQPLTSPGGREQYLRGRIGVDESGSYVTPVGGPGSHLLAGLAAANGLIVVPADVTSLDAGARVDVLALDEEF